MYFEVFGKFVTSSTAPKVTSKTNASKNEVDKYLSATKPAVTKNIKTPVIDRVFKFGIISKTPYFALPKRRFRL